MPLPRALKTPQLDFTASAYFGIVLLALACSDAPRSDSPMIDRAAPPAPAMGEMFSGLMGGCAVLESQTGTPSIEFIIEPGAASSPTRIELQADTTSSKEISAEFTGGGTRVGCSGGAPMIRFGGTAMMLGNAKLKVKTSTPVTVSARTTTAQVVAGPVTLEPGKTASLTWGQR